MMSSKVNWGRWESKGRFANKAKLTGQFADRVFKHVAQQNGEAYARWDENDADDQKDFPLRYNERCWSGHVAAALANLNPFFMAEWGITRKLKRASPSEREESSGRIDFWTFFQPSHFAIELKWHYLNCAKTSHPTKDLKARWESVTSQAQQAADFMKRNEHAKPVAVAILAIFAYEHSSMEHEGVTRLQSDKLIEDVAAKLGRNKKPWIGAWYPPNGPSVRLENEGARRPYERCPAVYFLGQSYC